MTSLSLTSDVNDCGLAPFPLPEGPTGGVAIGSFEGFGFRDCRGWAHR